MHRCALAAYGPSAIHRRSWIFMENLPWSGIRRDERLGETRSLPLFTA
jgi:ribonuclease HII